LAIGRALMANPKLLLLDEPSLGLAPIMVSKIFKTIKEINEEGVTILLVEQNAKAALRLSHRGYVLENGVIKLSGRGEDLLHNENVKKAYLGD
ncbi:MAG TPA: ABC transporter ATP-binding protein, partial [Nitrospiraceae bacterium]|nr:ABC transporter ATP-binding protein [Nitrospiraceae bacterium]